MRSGPELDVHETGAEQFYFSPLYAWLGGLSEQPAFVLIGK
jgi:hypothetical protein